MTDGQATQTTNPRSNRLIDVAWIVVLWTLAAPTIGALMLFLELIALGWFNSRYAVAPAGLPKLAGQVVYMACMVGGPVAFVTGVLFASFVGFAKWRALWAAILASLIPVVVAHHVIPAIGDPIWKWDSFWASHVAAYAAIPSAACWLIWRRWPSG